MSGYQTFLQLSALAGFWGAYISNSLLSASSSLQWQIPVAMQLVPGILLLLGTFCILPETPRYLAEKNDFMSMEESIKWLRDLRDGDSELVKEIEEITLAADLGKAIMDKKESFGREILKKGVRKRLFVGVGLMIGQNMVGLNALNYCRFFLRPENPILMKLIRCAGDLHVCGVHICLLVFISDWRFRACETAFCYRIHVCFCSHQREPVLAHPWIEHLWHLHADPR